jgi:lysophospholipase L1-like esterase
MAGPGEAAASGWSRVKRDLLFAGLSLLLVLSLVVVDIIVLGLNTPARAFSPHYYMALGNSLSFGYQPNFDFSSGFADDVFNDLRKADVTDVENLGCAGETTETMIQGGCALRFAHKGFYTGPQLRAAVDFLSEDKNRGRVSPVTLEIGANDILPDWNQDTCSASSSVDVDLALMDSNLTRVILPQLVQALTTPTGAHTGDLHMLNYYNPFARACSNSAPFIHEINDHLAADAAQFKIPVVDVYNAFGGDSGMASNICGYTWYCSRFKDIHPTNAGYRVIANAVEATLGLPGYSPLPGMGAPASAPGIGAPAGDAAPRDPVAWRRPTLA